MLASIGSDELTEWMAFERIEPFGSLVDEFRFGNVAAQTLNAARQSKEDHYFTADDFAPALKAARQRLRPPPKRELTPDEYADLLDAEIFGYVKH